jgi:ssDNA-binding Zn-finger/Zn-ribbon topoisomerase 1
MSRRQQDEKKLEVVCPCCGDTLTVDAELGKVLFHQAPPKQDKGPDLDFASQLLKKEAERREALFRQSADDQKTQSELLDRKFKEAFEKTKDQPTGKPLRDFDLD